MSTNQTAVITGTSTGFGYLTAQTFAAAGYTVFGTMRETQGRNAAPKAALEKLGVHVLDVDVTDQASVDRAAEAVHSAAGHVDVLVNNAGTAHFGLLESHTPESLERQFATNVVGPHRINRAFLPGMRARTSGLIVFISSVVGRFTLPFGGVYASSKWALEAQAESLSYELRPLGIDVAIIEPGAYATNISNVVVGPDDPARAQAYPPRVAELFAALNSGLAGNAGDAREVSDAIFALAKLPAGARPLRTAVPRESVAESINNAVEPLQTSVIETFGLGELLPAAVVSA